MASNYGKGRKIVNHKYFLITMWIEDNNIDGDKVMERPYKNVIHQGYWNTQEKAEKALLDNWFNLHEHWNNTAVIEEIREGFLEGQSWDFSNWWYQSKDIVNFKPVLIETPFCCQTNNGKHDIMFF